MVPSCEPHWRTNSSFSPPSRGWDCRFQSDGLLHGFHGASIHGSSFSSNSKGSRNRVGSDPCPSHQHSVSDGVISYFASPSHSCIPPRWTPLVPNLNSAEFSTPAGGSRPGSSLFAHSTERQFNTGTSAVSNSFSSPSSLSESSQQELTGKGPIPFPPQHFPSRCSFRSKPIYPLVFSNPMSDGEAFNVADKSNISRLTSSESRILPFHSPDDSSSLDLKFHKTLMELQRMEDSPDPSLTSRRDGFRWSNASSYDGESFDVADHIAFENPRSFNCLPDDQKCGLCGKLMWQKSPWSSYRIVRGGDMPIAGVLSCCHIFHADCLEQVTPKSEICDPPCPLCLKATGTVVEPSASESLEMALRSARRNHGVVISDALGINSCDNHTSDNFEATSRRIQSPPITRGSGSNSSMKNHLKKHFTSHAKMGRNFFHRKLFHSFGSSSSSHAPVAHLKSVQSSKK